MDQGNQHDGEGRRREPAAGGRSAAAPVVGIQAVPGRVGATAPVYATPGSAGADLTAAVDAPITVAMGDIVLIPTGLRIALPDGFEGQVRPRSGLALKAGLTIVNAPGTIDSDYRGEVKVIVTCLSKTPCVIRPGDRIAQLVIAPVARGEFRWIDDLPDTARGERGFGHTGVATISS
jgi:dUTP pyrophosphatase